MDTQQRLVVAMDDEEIVLKVVKNKLERAGYQVLTETTGKGGMVLIDELIRRDRTSLVAVLLDLIMRDENGLDILKDIKKQHPDLAVIIVTGIHNEDEARQAITLGALEYITKPIDFDYLINVLNLQ